MDKPMDNYDSTWKNIAAYILNFAPDGLKERDKEGLLQFYEGPENTGHGYLHLDFDRGDGKASCSLSITMEKTMEGYRPVEDNEGNLWFQYRVKTEVNYPSYGADSPGVVLSRIALVYSVAQLAKGVQDMFMHDVWQLWETKQDRDNREQEKVKKEKEEKLRKLVESNCKCLRVNRARVVVLPEDLVSIVSNEFFTYVGTRKYSVNKTKRIDGTFIPSEITILRIE